MLEPLERVFELVVNSLSLQGDLHAVFAPLEVVARRFDRMSASQFATRYDRQCLHEVVRRIVVAGTSGAESAKDIARGDNPNHARTEIFSFSLPTHNFQRYEPLKLFESRLVD